MTEPTLYPESGFLRLRIDLAYDGTNFSGWGRQPDRRTVQEEVEKALTTATQSKIETIVAGRTDAGVHATGQVIHVDVPDSLNLDELSYKLLAVHLMLDFQRYAVTTHTRFWMAIKQSYRSIASMWPRGIAC
jgi:tRNA pseudouridine(38-40) synthase